MKTWCRWDVMNFPPHPPPLLIFKFILSWHKESKRARERNYIRQNNESPSIKFAILQIGLIKKKKKKREKHKHKTESEREISNFFLFHNKPTERLAATAVAAGVCRLVSASAALFLCDSLCLITNSQNFIHATKTSLKTSKYRERDRERESVCRR